MSNFVLIYTRRFIDCPQCGESSFDVELQIQQAFREKVMLFVGPLICKKCLHSFDISVSPDGVIEIRKAYDLTQPKAASFRTLHELPRPDEDVVDYVPGPATQRCNANKDSFPVFGTEALRIEFESYKKAHPGCPKLGVCGDCPHAKTRKG